MKTSAMLAILAVGAIVVSAGVAVAAGPVADTLSTQDGDGNNGMMERNGGCHGSYGQAGQYMNDGDCPCDCQAEFRNNYSWSYGDGNMTCERTASQTQSQNQGIVCSGTCDNNYDWNHSWRWYHCLE